MKPIVLVLFLPNLIFCQEVIPSDFRFDDLCAGIYASILNLDRQATYDLLARMEEGKPPNGMYVYLQDYLEVLPVILNEDQKAYREGRKKKDRRLRKLQRLDSNSPWRLYCLGEIHLRWAIADYKMGHEWRAGIGMIKAYNLLKENAKEFPEFRLHDKSLGLIQALVGSIPIPTSLKWIVSRMTGISPSVEEGYKKVETLAEDFPPERSPFGEETHVALIYMNLHLLNQPKKAWQLCQQLKPDPATSLLACFVVANVAMRTGRNNEAIELLTNRPGSGDISFAYLDLMLGQAKLQRLDEDANVHLLRFLEDYPGESYRKSVYEKLYWHEVLFGSSGESGWRDRIRLEGQTNTDADRESAFQEAFGDDCQSQLLRSRLLFDGAYYHQARAALAAVEVTDLNQRMLLEYTYRKARIDHMLGDEDAALDAYREVIRDGSDSPAYYACNAALQSGLILEAMGRNESAQECFDLCLDMHPAGYVRSLHMKARAGLSRMRDHKKKAG